MRKLDKSIIAEEKVINHPVGKIYFVPFLFWEIYVIHDIEKLCYNSLY